MKPPRCPNRACPRHACRGDGDERGRGPFFTCKGTYRRQDDSVVRRFRCRECGRHFSEQTFNAAYRQRRPDVNAECERLAAIGLGSRTIALALGINRKTARLRLRRHAGASLFRLDVPPSREPTGIPPPRS